MRSAAVGILCALAFTAQAADPKWTTLRSEHFEMMTSAGLGASRDTLRNFEQIRGFFEEAFKFRPREDTPLRIVVFGAKKDYTRYAFSEAATAYYETGYSHDAIVLGDMTNEVMPIAVHEYFHLVLRQSGIELPLWANEGLADLYSTLKPVGKQVLVGTLPPWRLQSLQTSNWVALDKIIAADQSSGYYNEKNKASAYYAEAWALMHMLALSEQYRPKFNEVYLALARGEDTVKTLERVYGKSLRTIDGELQGYLRGAHFRGVLYDVKLQRDRSTFDEAPTPAYDQALALNDLLQKSGAEVTAELERIIASDPKRNEGYISRGYRAWHAGNNDAAERDFARGFELGARNPRLLWDLARMASYRDPKTAAAAAEALVAQQSDRVEARVLLGQLKLNDGDAKGAYAIVGAVHSIKPKEAPDFFRVIAFASVKLEKWDEAKLAAERLRQNAKDDRDRADAERVLKFLAHRTDPQPAQTRVESAPELHRGPSLNARRESDSYLSEQGTWIELACPDNGAPALVIKTGAGATKRFLIDKPDNIDIQNTGGGVDIDLTCGPQKPTPVVVKYAPAKRGADGLLRGIKFDQPISAKP